MCLRYGGYRDRPPPRRGYDGGYGQDEGPRGGGGGYRPPQDPPAERPRLQLQPRSKQPTSSSEDSGKSSSIFGGARPVDTATREQEIEQRLQREDRETQQRKEVGSRARLYGLGLGCVG